MKRYFYLIAGLLCFAATVSSCSDDDSFGKKPFVGSKIMDMKIHTAATENEKLLKGLNATQDAFDEYYTPDSIFLHKKGSDEVIQLPVYSYNCDNIDCDKGFRYHIEVDEDGNATIIPLDADGEQISEALQLKAGDEVYLSSWSKDEWALPDEQVSSYDEGTLYYRKRDTNVELYRSSSNYSISNLCDDNFSVQMERGTAAFNVVGLFYDRSKLMVSGYDENLNPESYRYDFDMNAFADTMGSPITTWYIKVMIGGESLTDAYNYSSNTSTGDTPGGYYTSGDAKLFDEGSVDQSKYLRFTIKSFGTGRVNYQAGGYYTSKGNELFTPVTGDSIRAYVFIKHWTGEGEPTEEWLLSDNGALATDINLHGRSCPTNNNFYTIGLLMPFQLLKEAWENAGGDAAAEAAAGSASILSKGINNAGIRRFEFKDATVIYEVN